MMAAEQEIDIWLFHYNNKEKKERERFLDAVPVCFGYIIVIKVILFLYLSAESIKVILFLYTSIDRAHQFNLL